MNAIKLENVQCIKSLGITIASSLKFYSNAKKPQVKLIECWALLTELLFQK